MGNDQPEATVIVQEQDEHAVLMRNELDAATAERAVEGIHNAEKVSGFGRFAMSVQNLFQQHSGPTRRENAGQWRAAPVVISAGLLLVVAGGLLFVLSKPADQVSPRSQQTQGLRGPDDNRSVTGPDYGPPPVTEDQLAGGEATTTEQLRNPDPAAARNVDSSPTWRHSGPAYAEQTTPFQSTGNTELQSPATVFVASPIQAATVRPQASKGAQFQLPSGTEITAHTTNSISSGLDSPVVAVVDRDIELSGSVVIPRGSRVIGNTAGAIKNRVNVRFTSLILPDQSEVPISGLALMRDGSAGLVGKAQGSSRPVLAGVGRVATGAAVLATQFFGRSGSLNQPFSQADYLRNQAATEIASEGTRLTNRLQQPLAVPIVNVAANQSIRIFLLGGLRLVSGQLQKSGPEGVIFQSAATEEDMPGQESLDAAQAAYIQALEAQLAEMKAVLARSQVNGRR